MADRIYTRDGWKDLDDVELEDEGCIDCDDSAEVATFIGYDDDDGGELYWAQCRDCAHESECCSRDGARRSEYELDYYSGCE